MSAFIHRRYTPKFFAHWVVAHATAIASTSLVALMIVGALMHFPNRVFCAGSLACAILAGWGLWRDGSLVKREANAAQLRQFGSILSYCAYPRPGTSLLEGLNRWAHINPKQIDALYFQTCNFSNPYLEKLGEHFAESGVRTDIRFEIIGHGPSSGMQPLKNMFPNVKFINSRGKLTTHFNLVQAAGRFYLWFEPIHDDEYPDNYVPSKGAFLVAVNDPESALRRFHEQSEDAVEF